MLLPRQELFLCMYVRKDAILSSQIEGTQSPALADLERLGIVDEVTGRKRCRVFSYRRYLAILSEASR